MSELPKNIKVNDPVWANIYGISYFKEGGSNLYADMSGGWTPEELEAIAADIRERLARRKKS